jgi:hypothetical protein
MFYALSMSGPTRILTVTEAVRWFADVVEGAFRRHETTVLYAKGVPVAHVAPVVPTGVPARLLSSRWALLPHLHGDDAADFAADVTAARTAQQPSHDT